LSALLRVATIESIGSSTRIEGSKLSDRDVERLLSNLQIKKFDSGDEQEVAGYAKVMEMVFTSWQDIALTENHIKQLHRDLLVYSDKDAWHRGKYKTSTNSVVAFDENGKQLGVVFETATPFDTPRLMTELVSWFVGERSAGPVHPLLLIGVWAVVFLEIHPFQDGKRAPESGADHLAAGAGRLRVRALQLAGERGGAEQGGLLPRAAPDPGHDPQRGAEVATLVALLPAVAGRAGQAPEPEDRAREAGAGAAARVVFADRRVRA
jgi:hypothetical protein